MRKFGLAILLGSALLLSGCGVIYHKKFHLHVALSGANEVPARMTSLNGNALIDVHKKEYFVEVSGAADATHVPRAGHFHCAKAGVNGPVVYGFATDTASWRHRDGRYALNGEFSDSKFSPNPVSATCPIVVNSYDSLRKAIRDGYIYINIHTQVYPGGEIRGQVLEE